MRRRMIFDKRAQSLATNKLVLYIIMIAALTAVLVGMWLYGGDLMRWAKNLLPEYQVSEEDEEIIIGEDESIKDSCDLQIGRINGADNYLYLCEELEEYYLAREPSPELFLEGVKECNGDFEKTKLLIKGENMIYLDRPWNSWGNDLRIGDIRGKSFYFIDSIEDDIKADIEGLLSNFEYKDRNLLPSRQAFSYLKKSNMRSSNRICVVLN